jgi:8-oxo-dGTP diphosphatase
VSSLPRQLRVAAYAVILRNEQILLCKLAPRISAEELWTLPGGGVEHGEHPRDAVLREVAEETGLDAQVGDAARVYSAHLPGAWRGGARVDAHALRIVYDGWVATDAPQPRVVEVDGSTVEAAWVPLRAVLDGTVPVVALVREALADHRPFQLQRVAAYAVIRRGDALLLTRLSSRAHDTGSWTLPGGGVDHGEPPAEALAREVAEECGVPCQVGELLDVHDLHFAGTAPSGRHEDFHGIHLVFAATVAPDAEPHVVEVDGTTDAVAWVSRSDILSGSIPVLDVVRVALAE